MHITDLLLCNLERRTEITEICSHHPKNIIIIIVKFSFVVNYLMIITVTVKKSCNNLEKQVSRTIKEMYHLMRKARQANQ